MAAEWDTLVAFPIVTKSFANIQSLAVDSLKKKKKVWANKVKFFHVERLAVLIGNLTWSKCTESIETLKNAYIYCGFTRSLSSSGFCGPESTWDFHTGLTGWSEPAFQTAASSSRVLLLQLCPHLNNRWGTIKCLTVNQLPVLICLKSKLLRSDVSFIRSRQAGGMRKHPPPL